MNKDLERFENRSDDWLAKQRKSENKVSAWDFDEGMKIKEYHEEHCEAKEIKERHEKIHSGQIKGRKKNNTSALLIVILMIALVNIIPEIIIENNYSEIPVVTLCLIVFTLAMVSVLKKGKQ